MIDFKPLSTAEARAIQRSWAKLWTVQEFPCTYCRYCDPCPYGVNIASVFQVYNRYGDPLGIDLAHPDSATTEQKVEIPRPLQEQPGTGATRLTHCSACGACLPRCPQHIAIPKNIRAIDDLIQKYGRDTGKGVI